ncbi:hypothetical protein GCM10022222_37110 [Amycolatopsis ultiminotia]|uniref:Uncharacterized protein n=1 Tax=Amycolatopsis ultiminotia TaxID=543629 RepID=A0ABP6WD29_9PSEU
MLGGPLADDPARRQRLAVGGYTATAVLSSLIGTAGNVVTAGLLRAARLRRSLRCLQRADGFERTMDNLGAIVGPLLALALVAVFSVRTAILVSVVPGLFAAAAIVYAIRQTRLPAARGRRKLRFRLRPVLHGSSAR